MSIVANCVFSFFERVFDKIILYLVRDGNLEEIVCLPCIQTASNGMICCILNQDMYN